jgi:peptidoglycan/xylan/chitin deacetylase (PgdA/CDA1 family)
MSRRSFLASAALAGLGAPAVASATHGRPSWPGGARAAVSLTYDDGLNSQLDNVVPELDRRGLKGTFFLTEENIEARLADWVEVARQGHEVANHTMTHPCSLRRFSAAGFERRELDRMEGFLDENFGPDRARTFAYPCGYLGLGHGDRRERFGRFRRILQHDDLMAARTTAGGPNRPAEALADPFRLHAFEPTYDADSVAAGLRYLTETVAMGGWAILVFHEVLPRWHGEGDASIATHRKILDHIASLELWCAPMGQAFNYVESRWGAGPRLALASPTP